MEFLPIRFLLYCHSSNNHPNKESPNFVGSIDVLITMSISMPDFTILAVKEKTFVAHVEERSAKLVNISRKTPFTVASTALATQIQQIMEPIGVTTHLLNVFSARG